MTTAYTKHLLKDSFDQLSFSKGYYALLLVLGLPVHLVAWIIYRTKRSSDTYVAAYNEQKATLEKSKRFTVLEEDYIAQEQARAAFFKHSTTEATIRATAKKLVAEQLHKETLAALQHSGIQALTYRQQFSKWLEQRSFVLLTMIPALLMYVLLLLCSNAFVRFIVERLFQTIFVIVGVATLVFTILYFSPFDPARNLLGVEATQAQIDNFNRIYGLDQPYLTQLWHSLTGLFTFDLGLSFAGKEDITQSILNKFPVTLQIALFSLVMAVIIAIPVGIISAIRPNSAWDYTFMLLALIGLSIPSFWQGLIFILTFSLELKWFPATYSPSNWLSLIMPVVVLGTSITASIARMTRSSMLEVIHEDYILTAKAKGLSERTVISKHAIRNAMIPIITVIGLLFGGMLGGAAVTEKVFNISGIGSYIVDKQFIPDIPAILGGVVYIAITISIVNLIIDILYAFFDPRIRSKMKKS